MTPFRHADPRPAPEGEVRHGPFPPFLPVHVIVALALLVGIAADWGALPDQEIACGMHETCVVDGAIVPRTDIKEVRAEDGRIVVARASGTTWRSRPTPRASKDVEVLQDWLRSGSMVTVSVPSMHRWLPFQAIVLIFSLIMSGAILFLPGAVRIRVTATKLEARHGSRVVEIPIEEVGDVVVAVKSRVVRRLEVVRKDGSLRPLTKAFFRGDEMHERAAARVREAVKLDAHEGDGELLAKAHTVRIRRRIVWLLAIEGYAATLVILLKHGQMDLAWVPAAVVVAALVKTALVRYELPL